jgi:hypothetical protein
VLNFPFSDEPLMIVRVEPAGADAIDLTVRVPPRPRAVLLVTCQNVFPFTCNSRVALFTWLYALDAMASFDAARAETSHGC